MILISHRGNIDGKQEGKENKPSYIAEAINRGFDCEVDIWFTDGKFVLGYDFNGNSPSARFSSIKIYNKTFTVSEVTQNYNALKDRFQ